MLAMLLVAADKPDKTLFYVFAVALIAFALTLAAIGTARHETFPPSRGVATGLMLLAVVLVAGTMFSAVATG
jgi:hypothetical protein